MTDKEPPDFQIALSINDARKIAEALQQTTVEHPDCEFELRFADEEGELRKRFWNGWHRARPSESEN